MVISATRHDEKVFAGALIATLFHFAAQAIVGVAEHDLSDARHQHRRHGRPARGMSAQSGCEADHRRLVRQGLWRRGRTGLSRGHAITRQTSIRCEQGLLEHDRARSYAATFELPAVITRCGNSAWSRRSQLESSRPAQFGRLAKGCGRLFVRMGCMCATTFM